MIITCKACNTSFNLDDKMLKPTGSKVRCSVCSKVFTAFPQQAPAPDPSAERVDPEKDVIREDTDTPMAGGADLDFGMDDEISTSDIDDAVSDALNADLPDRVDESGATVIANLDDDLDLDGDELDLSLDGQTDVEETVIADLDMEDFDLDAPSATDGDPDGNDTIIANLDDDELDLDSDFSMEPVDAAESEASAAGISPGTMEDIDDLDLTLELGGEGAGDAGAAVESPGLEDDLDLSSLESLLQDDDDSDDDAVTMVVDSDEEPELALEMDDVTPMAEADGEADASLESLESDLDEGDGADQDVDLSEIEKMLEDTEPESAKFSSVPEQDLDLDIEASLDTEKWMSESGDKEQLVVDDELDLSEIEQVLDDVDTNAPEDAAEDPELDLDLADDDALGRPTETVAVDDELEFDLSDFEDVATPPSDGEMAVGEPADMELEFEVEEASQEEPSFEDSGLEEAVAKTEPKADNTMTAMSKPTVRAAASPPPVPVKKGMSKSLIFLLILAIIGGAGYGTYYLLEKNGIEIPFLSDYLKPKVDDPGNLKLTTYDINSRFIDNTNVGKLFVISGQVKNGYTNNRGMVTLMGSIFSANKTLVQQEKVYGGNVMSDLELSNLEWDQIKARQSNRLGDNRSNVKIEPEASIPFMVVFSDLPDDLEEFTIEVTGSTSLK